MEVGVVHLQLFDFFLFFFVSDIIQKKTTLQANVSRASVVYVGQFRSRVCKCE